LLKTKGALHSFLITSTLNKLKVLFIKSSNAIATFAKECLKYTHLNINLTAFCGRVRALNINGPDIRFTICDFNV